MDYAQLQKECVACTRCGLCRTRTHVVFGSGPSNASILFVGEGPGYHEDQEGLPFVGKSGQLLDHYLAAMDLDRTRNVYITNIVKCRPPENRDPLPEESAACLDWLREQFRVIRPKIVVCLGRVAAQQLIGRDFSMTRQHGQFIEKGGVWFTATYHPAALLRSPGKKPEAFEDFLALRTKIRQVCPQAYEGFL